MKACCMQVQQMCGSVLWTCAASLSPGTHLYICLCDAKPLQGWLCFLKHALQETHGKAESGDEAMHCTTPRWNPWQPRPSKLLALYLCMLLMTAMLQLVFESCHRAATTKTERSKVQRLCFDHFGAS
jgi:hypothetical protein